MRVAVAFGSNMGDRLANLRRARDMLQASHEGPADAFLASSVYETEPVDCTPGTLDFFNAVVEMDYEEHPMILLDELHEIEKALGRPGKRPRNAPRPIDLDILYAGNMILNNEEIIIPHPRFHLRRFVLQPLAEIRPDYVAPGHHLDVRGLLAKLPDDRPLKQIRADW